MTEEQTQMLLTHVRELTHALADTVNFIDDHMTTKAAARVVSQARAYNNRLYGLRQEAGIQA
jgi:hypothetical protein